MSLAIIKGHMQKRHSKQWQCPQLQNLQLNSFAVNRVPEGFHHIQQHARLVIIIHKVPVVIYPTRAFYAFLWPPSTLQRNNFSEVLRATVYKLKVTRKRWFDSVYLLTSGLPRHSQHFVKSWKLIHFGNLTLTLFYKCVAIVVLEVTLIRRPL